MYQSINKLSGVYQIKNTINNKIYIGHSTNISLRWYFHIDNLIKGIHPNYKMQNDFNQYGLSSFSFIILELLSGKQTLIQNEQKYLNDITLVDNYNIINSDLMNINPNKDKFINYINSKW